MKQVINGKLYDTETAERIASYNPVADKQDFGYLYERLMRTPNDRYFLAAEGGAKTKYATSTGNGRTSGSTIKPLSEEEALQWCERREIDGETVAEEFAGLIEDA